MSTPAIIKVMGGKIQLYKHHDGYPVSTLEWLQEFNRQFSQKRGYDIPYKEAQLVRSSVFLRHKYSLDPCTETGWGIFTNNCNVKATYEYTLHEDGSVTYKKV